MYTGVRVGFLKLFTWGYRRMYLPNPSATNRMLHKVNFLAEYTRFELRIFLLLD